MIFFALYSGAILSWLIVTEVTEQKDSTFMAIEKQSEHDATEDSLITERPDASTHQAIVPIQEVGDDKTEEQPADRAIPVPPELADSTQGTIEDTREGFDTAAEAMPAPPELADSTQGTIEDIREGFDTAAEAMPAPPELADSTQGTTEDTREGFDTAAGATVIEIDDFTQATKTDTIQVCDTEQTSNGICLMILDGSCPLSFCTFFANLCLSKKGTWCCKITELFLRVLLPFVFPVIIDFLLFMLTTFSPIFSYYLPSPYLTHAVGNFIFYNPFMLTCSICYCIRAFCFLTTQLTEWMPCFVCKCLGQTCKREAELPEYIEHHLRMQSKLWTFKFTPCHLARRILMVLFLPVIGTVLTSPALCVSYRGMWLTPKLFKNGLLRGFVRILEFFVIFFAVLGTVFVSIFTAVGMVTFLAGLIITLERYPEKTFLSLVSLTFVFHSLWVHYNTFTKQINQSLSKTFTSYQTQYDKQPKPPKLINYEKDNKIRIPKDLVEDVWEKLTPVRERVFKLVRWILIILALNFIVVSFTLGTAYSERTTFLVLGIPKIFELVNQAEDEGPPDAIVDKIVQDYVTRILNPNQSDV